MNSSSFVAQVKKNKRKVLILSSFLTGLAFVGIAAGISFTFKYNGKHPREEVQQFVKKVKYVAFNPEKISENSDFLAIKSLLFDGNTLKNTIKLDDYLIPYYFSQDSKQLVKFAQQNQKTSSPVFDFVDLNFDDLNQNFIIKFRARQQITDQEFAYSDFVLSPVSFYDSRKFLKADFNFALQKITEKIEEAVSNFNTIVSNFSEENSDLAKNHLYRALDFAAKINSSENSSQVEENLAQIFPKFTDLISSVRNSKENLIPNKNERIFDINFAKDAATNQFVSVQNNIATMFLQTNLTQSALDQLGDNFEINGNKIININLESKDKKSIFLDVNEFFANLKLKPLVYNTEEKDTKLVISKQNPFDFFAKIKFESNPFLKNSSIKDLINSLLVQDLSLDFANFNKSIPSDKQGIDFIFDTPNAKLINDNGKYIVELPYKIVLNESFFDNNSNEIINQKELILRIEGFGLPINSNFVPSGFGNFFIPGTQKGIIYQQDQLFDNKSTNLSQFISTFGEPVFAKVPLNKEELDNLILKRDYKVLADKLSLPSSYNYNFDNFEAKVKSWSGKTLLPSLGDISRFKNLQTTISINSSNSSQNLAVSSLVSNTFFKNPSDVAAFFANNIQQDPNKIAKTFFELAKSFGLLNQNRSSLQLFDDDLQEDIFKKAAKINLDNKNIQVLSFNNHFEDVFNQGFFSTLFLPQSIQTKIGDLKNKSASEVLAALKDQEIFKESKTNFDLNQIKENYKQSVKFATLADVLLAFYLKSAQLSNFLAWEKIDSNLYYEIVFRKGNEISKQTLDQEIKKITEQPKPEQESDGQTGQSQQSEQTQPSQQTAQAEQPQQSVEAPQNLTNSANYEYLTLNFYYNIGDERTNKFSIQTPVRKILINLSTEKIDPKVSNQEKLNSLADSIPSELLNFEVNDETFNKISQHQTSTTGQGAGQTSQTSQNSSLENDLKNLKNIKDYFSKSLQNAQLKFDIFPSFENSIKTDTINFLITVSILDKNSQSQNSGQNNTNQVEVLASRSLKISVKKSKNSQSSNQNQQTN